MTEIRAFLHWQLAQIRKAKSSDWGYFLAVFLALYAGISPTSTTVIFGISLDIWTMGIALAYLGGYVLYQIVSWQYSCFRREKEMIARELERRQ
jgi:ABC-type Co2+ transport system permease subunit